MTSRYSFGGDEHIFVECDEAMSLEAFFKSSVGHQSGADSANPRRHRDLSGQRLVPDQVRSRRHQARRSAGGDESDRSRRPSGEHSTLKTRIIEIPVLYNDPWTHETLMRFRDRHQAPDMTDIEYTAKINHLDGVDGFVKAHSRRRPGSSRWSASWRVCRFSTRWSSAAADPVAEIPAAAHRHAEADDRAWRLFRLHLFGTGRRRLPDVRHHADADLRSQSGDQVSAASSCACSTRATSSSGGRSIAPKYDQTVADVEAGKFTPLMSNVDLLAGRIPRRHRRKQRQADGGAPWPLKSSSPASRPRCRISAGPDIIISAFRFPAAWTGSRCAPPICWSATRQAPLCSKAIFLGPELEFTSDATVAVTGAELPPKVDGQPRATWTSFAVKKGQTLAFDFLKAARAPISRSAGGVDVPVVLGSRSTYTLGALGGYQGRKLAGG